MLRDNSTSPKSPLSARFSLTHFFHKERLWLLLLIVCVSLFHWRGLQPGYTFLPVDLANQNLPWRGDEIRPLQNVLISDPLYQFYPFLNTSIETMRDQQQWPLWNPDIMLGHPSLGDPLAQPFFPLLLVFGLVFGAARGFAIGLWFLAVLGACLTYGWLRVIRCVPAAAFIGALTYALSGYMITWFETPFWLSTLALLPGILLAYEVALQWPCLRYAALAALLLGLAILGGQFQFMIGFTLFWGLYAIGRSWESSRETAKLSYKPILILALVFVLGVLLSSVFLLPAVELLGVSRRVVKNGLTDPLPWQQLITLIVPNFYGSPTIPPYYWGMGNYSENTIYAGIVGLLLACAAPLTQKRFFTIYISLMTLVIVYFIVGGPGVTWLSWVPGLKYISLHRTNFILPLLVAYLAAQTLSVLKVSFKVVLVISALFAGIVLLAFYFDFSSARAHWELLQVEVLKATLLVFFALCFLWLAASSPRYQTVAQGGMMVLVFVDLFLYGAWFNPVGPIEQLLPRPSAVDVLESGNPQRVVALQRNDQVLFGPNVLSLFNLAEAGGYSSLVIERYYQLVKAADPELDVWWMNRQGNMITFSHPTSQLLDLFQVSHVLSPTPLEITAVRSEVVNDECVDSSAPLTGTTPMSGRFTVQKTAINRLDFLLTNPAGSQAQAVDLVIRLWEGSQNGRLVLESPQAVSVTANAELLVVFFAPEKTAPGRSYVWEVSTNAEETDVGLCLAADGTAAVSVYGNDWAEVSQDKLFVYERLAPLSRAYVVYAAEQVTDDAETVARLLDENFPLRHKALTADPLPLPPSTETVATPAVITAYTPTKVVIQADSTADGLLILGDQFYPGWRAAVDGQPASIHRVNHIFRGVLLPAGTHEVTFTFQPQSLRLGLWLSFSGVLGVLALLIFERRILAALDRFKAVFSHVFTDVTRVKDTAVHG